MSPQFTKCMEQQLRSAFLCRPNSRVYGGKLVAAAQKNRGIYFDYEPVDADDARQIPAEQEKRQEEFAWVQRARGAASTRDPKPRANGRAGHIDKRSNKQNRSQSTNHGGQRAASRHDSKEAEANHQSTGRQAAAGHQQASEGPVLPLAYNPSTESNPGRVTAGTVAGQPAPMGRSSAVQLQQPEIHSIQDIKGQPSLQPGNSPAAAAAAAAAAAMASVTSAGVAPEDIEAHQLLMKIFPPNPIAPGLEGTDAPAAGLQECVSQEAKAEHEYTAWLGAMEQPMQLSGASAEGQEQEGEEGAGAQPGSVPGAADMVDTVKLLTSGAEQLREFQALLGQLQVEGEVKHEAIPEEDSMPDDQVLQLLGQSDPELLQLLQAPVLPEGEVEELERALGSLTAHLDSLQEADTAGQGGDSEEGDDEGEGLTPGELEALFQEDPELRELMADTWGASQLLGDGPDGDEEVSDDQEGEEEGEDLELGDLFDALQEDPDIEPADRARAQFALSSIFNANLGASPDNEPSEQQPSEPVKGRPAPVQSSQVLAPKPLRPASS